MEYLDLMTGKIVKKRNQPTKTRVWKYQYPGKEVMEIVKERGWWYIQTPWESDPDKFSEVGCDTLRGAKADIEYAGGKVWSELVEL